MNVHLYAVVRVKVTGVQADSHEAAIEQATQAADLHHLLQRDPAFWLGPGHPRVEHVEFADDIINALVDEENDPEFRQSRWYRPGERDEHADWMPGERRPS